MPTFAATCHLTFSFNHYRLKPLALQVEHLDLH